jgi:AraC-like DNA-binding protein
MAETASYRQFDPSKIINSAFSYYPRLRRLERFVKTHYSEPIPLTRAAKFVGLERTYFSTYFHRKSGICFHEWLNWVRVQRAMEMFQESNVAVTKVCFEVGFSDLGTFERNFLKCTGLSPVSYKTAVRPSH